jgi:TolA-binding protein
MISAGRRFRSAMLATIAFVSAGVAMPAHAQDSEARLRKIEAEVRAIQRKVFPGGDGRFFAPETGAAGGTVATAPLPATTAMTDVLARLDALEAQIARLTGQVEQNTNSIALLTGRVTALEPPVAAAPPAVSAEPAAPAPSATSGVVPAAVPASSAAPAIPVAAPAPVVSSTVALSPPPPPKPAPVAKPVPAAKPAGPSAQRLAAVQEILKPATADAADDEYSYGYRLWEAKFFPEAQQQLRLYVDKYPRHLRISYGLNLLGRAYLDDGKPAEAAPWFLKNYQTDKQGARAGDSLLFLAQSMIATGDTRRACIALAEFGDTYPALATGRLLQQYEANRRKVKCN